MSLQEVIQRIRSAPTPPNEEAAKFQILSPILSELGWDPFNGEEVLYEHSVGGKKAGGKVDLALRGPKEIVTLIEAKAPQANLGEYVDQMLRYAHYEGVDICALTTGLEWWLYLPRESGQPEKRRFATLHVKEDPIEQLEEDFKAFLGKEALTRGMAVRQAKRVLTASLESAHLEEEIPSIWAKMLKEPDEELIELLSRRVYDKTNLRPAKEQVAATLTSSLDLPKSKPAPIDRVAPRPKSPSNRPPIAIELWGDRHFVKSWRQVTCTVATILHRRHQGEFHKILELRGKKHPFAARDPQELGRSESGYFFEIPDSGYFIDVNLSAKDQYRRSVTFLEHFGYSRQDLKLIFE